MAHVCGNSIYADVLNVNEVKNLPWNLTTAQVGTVSAPFYAFLFVTDHSEFDKHPSSSDKSYCADRDFTTKKFSTQLLCLLSCDSEPQSTQHASTATGVSLDLKAWSHGGSLNMFTVFQLVLTNGSSNGVETNTIR